MAEQDPRRTLARRTLGWGLAAPLIEAGDVGRDILLVPRAGSGRRDFASVEGAANLGQDLAVALTTGLGTDPFNAEFGFDGIAVFVEQSAPGLLRERMRASVAKTVARDPRVRSVTAVEVDDGTATRDATVQEDAAAEAQRRNDGVMRVLRLRVTVDTIASDTAALVATLL